MSKDIRTYNDLLERKIKVEIPIIQRDYAQGRNDKDVAYKIDNFLDSIKNCLDNEKELDFGFIYGNLEGEKFIPYDGQQRLTLLFLLYLYFIKKDNLDNILLKEDESLFTYETRASSREFCNEIVERDEIDYSKTNIKEQIMGTAWFLAFWSLDPTIISMLNVLDKIAEEFKDNKYYERLKNITFIYFPMSENGLDDDVYIKMNDRGKSLDRFENFKAIFIQFLTRHYKEEEYSEEEYSEESLHRTYPDHFSFHVDTEWKDKLWKILLGTLSIEKPALVINDVLEKYIMFITDMLGKLQEKRYQLQEKKEEKGKESAGTEPFEINDLISDFKKVETVYEQKENVDFLFLALQHIDEIYNNFTEIYSHREYEEGKVALFFDEMNVLQSLWNPVLPVPKDEIDLSQKIILFFTINFSIKDNISTNNFQDFIRIVRNLVGRIPAWDKKNFRTADSINTKGMITILEEFNKYLEDEYFYNTKSELYKRLSESPSLLNTNITQNSITDELFKIDLIEKTELKEIIFELEDIAGIEGNLAYFLNGKNKNNINAGTIRNYIEALKNLRKEYDEDFSLVAKALLSIEDGKIFISHLGQNAWGERERYGVINNFKFAFTKLRSHGDCKGDEVKWDDKILEFINLYIEKGYKLNKMIAEKAEDKTSWFYYWNKYDILNKSDVAGGHLVFVGELESFNIEKFLWGKGKAMSKENFRNPYLDWMKENRYEDNKPVKLDQDESHKSTYLYFDEISEYLYIGNNSFDFYESMDDDKPTKEIPVGGLDASQDIIVGLVKDINEYIKGKSK